MTLEEAEEYYKRYLGQGFHMGREEPRKYDEFKALNITKETLTYWDNELLQQEFSKLWQDPQRSWIHHGNILTILFRKNCDIEKTTVQLLMEMQKMTVLPFACRTLIIENMAGRNVYLNDGGVYFICTKTKQTALMEETMNLLLSMKTYDDKRYLEAVNNYKIALKKYKKPIRMK